MHTVDTTHFQIFPPCFQKILSWRTRNTVAVCTRGQNDKKKNKSGCLVLIMVILTNEHVWCPLHDLVPIKQLLVSKRLVSTALNRKCLCGEHSHVETHVIALNFITLHETVFTGKFLLLKLLLQQNAPNAPCLKVVAAVS